MKRLVKQEEKELQGKYPGSYERAFERGNPFGKFPNRKLSEELGPHIEEEGNDEKNRKNSAFRPIDQDRGEKWRWKQ